MPVRGRYPRIGLPCPRELHTIWTTSGPGVTVKCSDCQKAGYQTQISKRVPSSRPLNQHELTAWENRDAGPEIPLTDDPWADIPEWDGKIIPTWPPDKYSGVCGKCGKPRHWERARTVVWCLDCDAVWLAPDVHKVYAQQDEHTKEVVRPQRSKARNAKVAFGRRKLATIREIDEQIAFYSVATIPKEFRSASLKMADLFKVYRPLIADTDNDAEHDEHYSELMGTWENENGPELRDNILVTLTRIPATYDDEYYAIAEVIEVEDYIPAEVTGNVASRQITPPLAIESGHRPVRRHTLPGYPSGMTWDKAMTLVNWIGTGDFTPNSCQVIEAGSSVCRAFASAVTDLGEYMCNDHYNNIAGSVSNWLKENRSGRQNA